MKLISWNTAHRTRKAERQALALAERDADAIALQEVTRHSIEPLRRVLERHGYRHSALAVPGEACESKARELRVAILSRFPLTAASFRFELPWAEKGIAASVQSPAGSIEVYSVHVPPGRTNGWTKIRVFNGIYDALSHHSEAHRVLCGDFNAPQAELESGEVICWGNRRARDGQWRLKKRRRGGSAEEWERGEHSVLVGLGAFGLRDAYRSEHGYGVAGFSIEMRHKATVTRRRFDHMIASESLHVESCDYVHDLREQGLSDHAPIEAVLRVK